MKFVTSLHDADSPLAASAYALAATTTQGGNANFFDPRLLGRAFLLA